MEFYKGMKLCHYYETGTFEAIVIDILNSKKLNGSNVRIVVQQFDDGNVEAEEERYLKTKARIKDCAACENLKCKAHPKYVPPPPPDSEKLLANDVKEYAERLAISAITGDVSEEQVYESIMKFLERKKNLINSFYDEDDYDD